ncbi:hypothetical protein EK21DRAFT_82423, partial [Setomelanomma holmii]
STSRQLRTTTSFLVILCAWTRAKQRYIAKYTKKYSEIFPAASIMVVLTTAADLCFRSSHRKQNRLQHVVQYLNTDLEEEPKNRRILMHAFSEGGSNKACELARAYFNETKGRLPVSALYLDSTPGRPRYVRLCNALSKSFPDLSVIRQTGFILCAAVVGAIWIFYECKGFKTNVIDRTRDCLLDTDLFDHQVPRCYFYSKSDELIAWQDVAAHHCSAPKNFIIYDECFEKSGHVRHALHDPKRYWKRIEDVWYSRIPPLASHLPEKHRL